MDDALDEDAAVFRLLDGPGAEGPEVVGDEVGAAAASLWRALFADLYRACYVCVTSNPQLDGFRGTKLCDQIV